jgi:hypothetical protein
MSKVKWLLGVMLVAMIGFSVPQLAFGQGTDDPTNDGSVPTVPQDPSADDPANDTSPPNLEPPQVLQDPGPGDAGVAPTEPTDTSVAPEFQGAPPVSELSRFSDEVRAPKWQQRDNWRPRGLFYHWRQGWFQFNRNIWWQWRGFHWVRCPQPGDWSPPVVRPVPVSDPAPDNHTYNPVQDAVVPIQAPRDVSVPQQQDRRQFALRRALRVCQARYVHSVVVLRLLRQNGRITFQQYRRGVQFALHRRAVCRRVVFRLFTIRN